MKALKRYGLIVFLALISCEVQAQIISIKGVTQKVQIYKIIHGDTLKVHIFSEAIKNQKMVRPAIVFFFGGGWVSGTPSQFYPQAEYFASLGMVAISADYRTWNKDHTSPFECVKDGKSAISWVRGHAKELHIDPNRIVASGGSAGGHVAACTALIPGYNTELENPAVSSRPDALVLFNPVIDTSPKGYGYKRLKNKYRLIDPMAHIKSGEPPTIIFIGTSDKTVPYERVVQFKKVMNQKGNMCEVLSFSGKKHGFFNYGRDHAAFWRTVSAADHFLVQIGILKEDFSAKFMK